MTGVSRIDELMATLSLEEKVAQISCGGRVYEMDIFDGCPLDEAALLELFPHGTGQLGRPSLGRDADTTRAVTEAIQRFLRSQTGIPALFNEEGVHGLMGRGATVFPSALGLAATWDPDLVEKVYAAVARETRARGSNYVYAPVLDLARDPRWGRVEETFGEEPCLVAAMGVAAVRGLQGDAHEIAADRVLACAKHFVGHGVPQGGVNAAPAQVGRREMLADHVTPFAAVIEEGVGAIMAAYHDWDGVPTHANGELLVDLLREELGFDGMVTSDGFGIPQLETIHHVAADAAHAARIALGAGIDCEVPEPVTTRHLADEVRAGRVPIEDIDRPCRRVLEAKERLGLLDDEETTGTVDFDRGAHTDLSRGAATKAVVLLTNRDDVLPIDPARAAIVAVSGPNAHPAHLGGYTDPGAVGTSVLDGIREVFSESEVIYDEGCRITDEAADASTWWVDHVELADPTVDDDRIERAAESASRSDIAVVVVGGNEATHREGWWFDHLGDSAGLEMVGRQDELVERIAATGTTTVAVVISGGPVDLHGVAGIADAVLWTCYPGEMGGRSIADVIAGYAEPGGRLPITFPRNVGQIPIHSGRRPSAGRGYLHSSAEPLFPIGYGLSYTSFRIDEVGLSRYRVDRGALSDGEPVEVTATVTNTGRTRGSELVRVLATDDVSSVARPREELADFCRVELDAGGSSEVRLQLGFDSLKMLDRELNWVVEPGTFTIDVVSTSGVANTLTLEVVH